VYRIGIVKLTAADNQELCESRSLQMLPKQILQMTAKQLQVGEDFQQMLFQVIILHHLLGYCKRHNSCVRTIYDATYSDEMCKNRQDIKQKYICQMQEVQMDLRQSIVSPSKIFAGCGSSVRGLERGSLALWSRTCNQGRGDSQK
jgi:hypothetical protein